MQDLQYFLYGQAIIAFVVSAKRIPKIALLTNILLWIFCPLGLGYTETRGAIRCHLKEVSCLPLERFPSFFLSASGRHETCFK